jgi:hypothetical protein
MPKLHLDWSDGRYSTRPLSAEEAAKAEAAGCDVVHLEDHVYDAYVRDCERDSIWQAFWRAVSNEQYMRRREKELMPLEDAEREIRRLKDDLAQAKRMWSFFEGEYAKHGQEKHREEYVEYTCIYPQPGCQVDALKKVPGMHPEWLEALEDIMEQPKFAARAAEGLKYQGCCCGHKHLLLADTDAQMLRDAGFLVENDTETV